MDADGYTYATRGISSGHDAAGAGPSHAICWERYAQVLTGTDVSNGYFIQNLWDAVSPSLPEWYAKTVGAIGMMSNAGLPGSTFQVSDWRSSSASGYFSVQVIYSDGTVDNGDKVKVTFDTSYYAAYDAWVILAFYTP